MLGRTHLAIGFLISFLLIKYFEVQNEILLTIIVLFGSIFLDIDEKHSFLGKKFKLISWAFKHRGFFHSIYALLLFSLLIQVLFRNQIYTAGFFIAYFVHLVSDSFTKKGIKPFIIGLRFKGFIRSGGFLEKVLFVILIVVDFYLLLIL